MLKLLQVTMDLHIGPSYTTIARRYMATEYQIKHLAMCYILSTSTSLEVTCRSGSHTSKD